MRADNRMNGALRPVTLTRHYTKFAEGSALVSFGDTKVICTASVDRQVPSFLKDTGTGWVTAEYAMLPRSTQQRTLRDASKKGRALEIGRLIGRSLRSVVDLAALGQRQIIVDCDVVQADGATRTASITGAYVALRDALDFLVGNGTLEISPLVGQCAAVSVGIVGGEILLDLTYEEDFRAEVDMNLVINGAGEIIEIQGCAEHKSFSRSTMDAMLDLAQGGVHELMRIQDEVLGRA